MRERRQFDMSWRRRTPEVRGGRAGANTSLEGDTAEARELRERLVATLVDEGDVVEPPVIEALRVVPRHLFVPNVSLSRAYANYAVAIGHEQTISQPAIVAMMTEALALSGHERVLEIGTGSGYQAAVLSMLVREVYSVERIPKLALRATERLAALGYANVQVRTGDGYEGWRDAAPFDRVVLTAAPPELPDAVLEQLAVGGVLVAPVGPAGAAGQTLVRIEKHDRRFERAELGGVFFVEMIKGAPST